MCDAAGHLPAVGDGDGSLIVPRKASQLSLPPRSRRCPEGKDKGKATWGKFEKEGACKGEGKRRASIHVSLILPQALQRLNLA